MGDCQVQCLFKGEYFVLRKTQECLGVFINIWLLCFSNEALECHTSKMEMETESFFVCVIGELDMERLGSDLIWQSVSEGEIQSTHSLKSLNKNLGFI